MHNKAYAVHDSFWEEYYPPNGWGCQCYVVSMDEEELQEYSIVKADALDTQRLASTTPQEWKQNSALETLVPRFGEMKYLQSRPDVMKQIQSAYAKDMRGSALTSGELASLAKKIANYGKGNQVPNVPVLLGAMSDEVWDAVKTKLPEVDVRLQGTTEDVAHAMREKKVHKVPDEALKHVSSVMSEPDVVYEEDNELIFWKEVEKEKYIRVAFGYKNKKLLRMRSFDYLEGSLKKDDVLKNKVKVYEK